MEGKTGERWDFSISILQKPTYMAEILEKLNNISDILRKFLVFLGPNLKKITENTERIDTLTRQVKDLVTPFIRTEYDYFDKAYQSHWNTTFQKFNSSRIEIEEKTKQLIKEAFQNLRSSEGAFDLL
mmetsp:Transcript_28715/g.25824  ORF Transcript_28715/g.25824 Transcript_28715/m.25824 type:complete len:127 (-) Transcript_28715:882-1262(-)